MLILRLNLFILNILPLFLFLRLVQLIILNRRLLIVNKITSIKSSVMTIGTELAFACLMLWFLFRFSRSRTSHRFPGCCLLYLVNLVPSLFYFLSHWSSLDLLGTWQFWPKNSVLLLSGGHIISAPTATSSGSTLTLWLILSTEFLPFLILFSLLLFVKKILRLFLLRFLNGQMLLKLTIWTMIAILACVVPKVRTLFFS